MVLPLTNPGVEQWSFIAWVCSYEQQQITLLDAGDAAVQQVIGAQVSAKDKKQKLRKNK